MKSNLINISEFDDKVLKASSSIYGQDLIMFKNGKIIKGYLESIQKDPNLEGGFIYKVSGYKKYKSSGEIIQ